MTSINTLRANGPGDAGGIDLGPNRGVQMMFAKMQLLMSNQSKVQAQSTMQKLEGIRQNQKLAGDMANKARELQQKAKTDAGRPSWWDFAENAMDLLEKYIVPKEWKTAFKAGRMTAETIYRLMFANTAYKAQITPEMKKFFEENGIKFVSADKKGWANEEEWGLNIRNLQTYQETVGNQSQMLMVLLQDYIGQYNAYLQGASATINDAKNMLSALIKG